MTQQARYHPSNGLSDQTFTTFASSGAERVGEPSDPGESERIEWVQVDRLRELVRTGKITDGLSLTALLFWLSFGAGSPERPGQLGG